MEQVVTSGGDVQWMAHPQQGEGLSPHAGLNPVAPAKPPPPKRPIPKGSDWKT